MSSMTHAEHVQSIGAQLIGAQAIGAQAIGAESIGAQLIGAPGMIARHPRHAPSKGN